MPIYEFVCKVCGKRVDMMTRTPTFCDCGNPFKRIFSFNASMQSLKFEPHWNHSIGQVVNSQEDFNNKLKKANEAQTLRTGAEHNYQPIDPRDMPFKESGEEK